MKTYKISYEEKGKPKTSKTEGSLSYIRFFERLEISIAGKKRGESLKKTKYISPEDYKKEKQRIKQVRAENVTRRKLAKCSF